MPIRVNLKELFPADSQEISVDKINFNFNKLLELGIGEQGIIGLTGPLGSAGPTGAQGEDGVRGSQWYVDSATDPNTLTFQDLLTGDLYLDSTNVSIWQWTGSTWTFVVDLTAVINNYLAATPSPFVRGLGIGPDSNKDHRFILFNRRGNTNLDIVNDNLPGGAGSNASNNDILFLNNFNEDTLEALLQSQFPPGFEFGPALLPVGNQIPSASLFNSLLSVQLDHTTSSLGRYHLDMGVLYESDPLDPDSEPKLTTVFENFKMRYLRVGSSVHPGQDHYNLSLFTLDIPEVSIPAIHRVTNGVFKFETPKFLPTIDNERSNFYIGSKYGLDEIVGTSGIIETDGALFVDEVSTIYANIGIAKNYTIPNLPNTGYIQKVSAPSESYFMLDTSGAIEAVLVNTDLYQNNGNIIQAGSGEPRLKYSSVARFNSPGLYDEFVGHLGIAIDGENIYTVGGCFDIDDAGDLQNKFGYFNKFSIDNPNRPSEASLYSANKQNGVTTSTTSPSVTCTPQYADTIKPIGPGASDVAIAGKHAYVVNTHNIQKTDSIVTGGSPSFSYLRTYFQVLKLDEVNDAGPRRISRLGQKTGPTDRFSMRGSSSGGNDPEELNSAYRIKIKDNFAIVATNALYNQAGPGFLGTLNPVPVNENYDGRITAIDITIPERPKIVASGFQDAAYKFTVTGPGVLKSAFMDFEIVGDKVFALTWEQNVPTVPRGFSPVCNIVINVNAFNISELKYSENLDGLAAPTIPPNPTIRWQGKSSTSFISSSVVDTSTYNTIFKRGAITSKEDKIYAGWSNEIRTYTIDNANNSGTIPNCSAIYPQGTIFTLPFSSGQYNGIVDMKRFGNTLWVLALVDGVSKLYKIDVSNGLLETAETLQLVSEKTINSPATRFEVVGKHLYLACHNTGSSDANGVALIAIDFDGLYTDGAHIGTLRTEKLDVTGDSHIGKDLTVQGSLNVGVGIKADATISAKAFTANAFYTEGFEEVEGFAIIQAGNPNGGLFFKGLGTTKASYDNTGVFESTTSAQWGVQYLRPSATDSNLNGLNFWKPFPSFNDGNYKFFLADSGRIGIGTGTPAHPIEHSTGAHLSAAGAWINASDLKLKENIEDLDYGLNKVLELRPVKYTLKSTGESQIGFIAQEVLPIVPEIVSLPGEDYPDNPLGLSYGQVTAVLTKAIQELHVIITEKDNKISELEQRLIQLEEKLS